MATQARTRGVVWGNLSEAPTDGEGRSVNEGTTLVGALLAAVGALAAAVGVLWRESNKRATDSHQVALGMLEVLTLLKTHVATLREDLDRLVSTRHDQLDRMESDARVHHERETQFHEANLKEHTKVADLIEQIRRRVYGPVRKNGQAVAHEN